MLTDSFIAQAVHFSRFGAWLYFIKEMLHIASTYKVLETTAEKKFTQHRDCNINGISIRIAI